MYNGKELEDEHNLYWYHSGARYYDPQLARWWVMDPLDVEYSPYNYVLNNPVHFIDRDGTVPDDFFFNENGELIAQIQNDQPDRVFILSQYASEDIDLGDNIIIKKGEALYIEVNAEAFKQFYAIVSGEASPNFEEARGIANVMLNRMKHVGVDLTPGFIDRIGGADDFDAMNGNIYHTLMNMSIQQAINSPYNVRIRGAISALSPLTANNTGCAYFWNATNQYFWPELYGNTIGWNFRLYEQGIYTITTIIGGTTFFKYNADRTENPDFYRRVWP